MLPGARGNAVVDAGEIGFGDLQIEHRLTFDLVFGFDDLARLVLAASAQAGAFAGVVVHTVEGPATNAATNQTVACFHAIFHATAKINEAESEGLADRRRLKTAYAVFLRIREMVSVLVSVADPAAPDSLLHPQLELAAEVGIEPLLSDGIVSVRGAPKTATVPGGPALRWTRKGGDFVPHLGLNVQYPTVGQLLGFRISLPARRLRRLSSVLYWCSSGREPFFSQRRIIETVTPINSASSVWLSPFSNRAA